MGTKLIRNLKYIGSCILEVIYLNDEKCILCNGDTLEKEKLCSRCQSKINIYNEEFHIEKDDIKINCYSVSFYQGLMKELILKLKYNGSFKAGEVLADYMALLLQKYNLNIDFITFVPSTNKVMKTRGYNQSQYLAKALGGIVDIKVMETLLKIKETKDQIGLDKISRWDNIYNSFKVKENKKIKNKKILLIDDVITTGATGFYCAEELIKSGAEKVTLLTAAKSKI